MYIATIMLEINYASIIAMNHAQKDVFLSTI